MANTISNKEAAKKCEETFNKRIKVILPNGSEYPNADEATRREQLAGLLGKIKEWGGRYVVCQDDNRSLTLLYSPESSD